MLKKKTTVNNVIIENLDGEIQFNENNFVNTTAEHFARRFLFDDLKDQ